MNNYFNGNCKWFWHPKRKSNEAGYTLFRRKITCFQPEKLRLAVSADNRFNLYLDGKIVGRGPCRSDLEHYTYEEYNLSLAKGNHLLAVEVVVWNGGWREDAAPWSEIHSGGGLMVCGTVGDDLFEGPENWCCSIDNGRRPLEWKESWDAKITTPVPPMDRVDFNFYSHHWMELDFDDAAWLEPVSIGDIVLAGQINYDPKNPWWLTPRRTAPMKTTRTLVKRNINPGPLPAGHSRLVIDIGQNQTSIIHLYASGGKGEIRLIYLEEANSHGYADILCPGPGEWQYHSFWYRTARYVEIICDLSVSLEIHDFKVEFITYDFKSWAEFRILPQSVLEKVWHIACHTARCCAHEHYEDCPYYEQLQYGGDTRIQALVSYSATGDGSLGRQALRHFDWSRLPNGLTQSRYPNKFTQIIPGFSLIWILSIYDHYLYFGNISVLEEHWNGIMNVLNYFEKLRAPHGLIEHVGHWNFTDWVREWPGGRSDRDTGEPETIVNLFYAESCRVAGIICEKLLLSEHSSLLTERRRITLEAVNACCFDSARKLYRDVPGQPWFSVHTNALAILADAIPSPYQSFVVKSLTDNPELSQGTLYFNFYLFEALKKYRDKNGFMKMLEPWIDIVNRGYTTFPESQFQYSRSKCHAWSASPVYEFITGLLGISPAAPGFQEVLVAPLRIPGLKFNARLPIGSDNSLEVALDEDSITLHPDKTLKIRLLIAEGQTIPVFLNSRQVFRFPDQ